MNPRKLYFKPLCIVAVALCCFVSGPLLAEEDFAELKSTQRTSNADLQKCLARLRHDALLPWQLQKSVLTPGLLSEDCEFVVASSDTTKAISNVVQLFSLAKEDVSKLDPLKVRTFCNEHKAWCVTVAEVLLKNPKQPRNITKCITTPADAATLSRVRNVGRAFLLQFICAIQEGNWRHAESSIGSVVRVIHCFDNEFSPAGSALRNDLVFRLCDVMHQVLDVRSRVPQDTVVLLSSALQEVDGILQRASTRLSLERAHGLCGFEKVRQQGLQALGFEKWLSYDIDVDELAYLSFMEKRLLYAKKPFYAAKEDVCDLGQDVRHLNLNSKKGISGLQHPLTVSLLTLCSQRDEEAVRAQACVFLYRGIFAEVLGVGSVRDQLCPFTGRKHEVTEEENGVLVVRFADGDKEVLLEIAPSKAQK